jgi:ABC-type ATPase involved in cell division
MNAATESSQAVVDLKGVTFRYPQGDGVSDINLRVHKGEFVVIEGPTGAGKTTLVRLLTGELPVEVGRGQVVGISLTNLKDSTVSELRGRLGIVFQEEYFLDRESVRANVAAPLAIDGRPIQEQKARAMKMLVEVGLARVARKRPTQLSGGQKARLQIARALIREPMLLLADEPFVHLDSESAGEVASLILRAHDRGTAVVVTTHRQDAWTPKARRLRLVDGRLQP